MATTSINALKGAIGASGGLRRQNRFLFDINGDTAPLTSLSEAFTAISTNYKYFVRTTTTPGRSFGQVELRWMESTLKYHGDPEGVQTLTVTFLNDEGFKMRTFFEKWIDALATVGTNVRHDPDTIAGNHTTINLYHANENVANATGIGDFKNDTLPHYELVGVWPSGIGESALSQDSSTEFMTFDVTLVYDYFNLTT